ncbi:MAG: hypothetical protein KAW66_07800 [Candidatus Lokiarchaeota archaeon]|nr:hypothetical protein [Candidatus Lokiarchaeota archaeon]
MTEKKHYYAVIKPFRQDFLINPDEKEGKIMSDHFHILWFKNHKLLIFYFIHSTTYRH